jgi:cell division protein FtsI (penicillin-binding protein 3)
VNERAAAIVRAPRWRVLVVGGLLAFCLCGLWLKAARLQLFLSSDLHGLAEEQYVRRLQLAAPRGGIFDRSGHPLALSVPAWSVFADPRLVVDKRGTALALGRVLGKAQVSKDGQRDALRALEKKLATARGFVWIERRVGPEVADAVRALDLPGIGLRKEMRRYAPNKSLAGQLLGLVDVDGAGRGGVEQALDEKLKGRASTLPSLVDNRGDRISLQTDVDLDQLEGDDVVLTLDSRLQHTAEEALADTVLEHKANAGVAVALDPKTGEVLALASHPPFNPNAPESGDERRNRALAWAFEPGSIFKVATFAAAIEAGQLDPNEQIYCEDGKYEVGRFTIHDVHKKSWLSATEVFQQSSNIGTVKIVQRLGEQPFQDAVRRYGFGQRPGLGLVEESSGRLPRDARWGDARLATVSFGHGVLVSAMQMASFVGAIANDGVRVPPRIIARVQRPGNPVPNLPAAPGERILSSTSAQTLTAIMKRVVEDGGTGTLAQIPGVEVAGKTGTAEKVDPVTKRYARELNVSSFVGFAPADDPAVVVLVVIDEPHGVTYGGTVAAPAWRRIVEQVLVERGLVRAPDIATARASVEAAAKRAGILVEAETPKVSREEAPTKKAGAREGTLDLRGLSAREAVIAAEARGIGVEINGTGRVARQEPAPSVVLSPGTRMRLTLAEAP